MSTLDERIFLLSGPRLFLFLSGDLAERVGGAAFRHICSILQSIQLVVNVGIICLYVGSVLSSGMF